MLSIMSLYNMLPSSSVLYELVPNSSSLKKNVPFYDSFMWCYDCVKCYLQEYINDKFTANEIGDTNNIFIGDLASTSNRIAMKEQGITHIVSVMNGTFQKFKGDFEYKIIHINDN